MTTILSKFKGTCRRCGRRFGPGTEIDWSRRYGATHHDVTICAEAATVPPPAHLASARPEQEQR